MRKVIYLFLIMLVLQSFVGTFNSTSEIEELEALKTELRTLEETVAQNQDDSGKQLATFLTFQNNDAEQAMNFYISLFENSKVIEVQKYGKDGPAKEGTIMVATFELNGSRYMCSDSYIKHEWGFTPGVSSFVTCKSDEEIERLFAALSKDGKVLMPLNNYGFSKKFAFIEDQFGVSWQLNLD